MKKYYSPELKVRFRAVALTLKRFSKIEDTDTVCIL